MEYYSLYLNNNKCSNKTKIDRIKLICKDEFDEELSIYENLEILAYKGGKFNSNYMIDLLTGKKIYLDDGVIKPNITYKNSIHLKEDKVKEILNKYSNLTKEELNKYKNSLNEIENISVNNYLEFINS